MEINELYSLATRRKNKQFCGSFSVVSQCHERQRRRQLYYNRFNLVQRANGQRWTTKRWMGAALPFLLFHFIHFSLFIVSFSFFLAIGKCASNAMCVTFMLSRVYFQPHLWRAIDPACSHTTDKVFLPFSKRDDKNEKKNRNYSRPFVRWICFFIYLFFVAELEICACVRAFLTSNPKTMRRSS